MEHYAYGANFNVCQMVSQPPQVANLVLAALAPPLTANRVPYQQPHKPLLDLLTIAIQNQTPVCLMDSVINLKEKKQNVEEIIRVIGEMDQEESQNKFRFA
jgi:hypothetical protein